MDFSAHLKNRNLKSTPNRLKFIRLIGEYGSAMPLSKIQELCSDMDRVTFYRTTKTLLENGVIHVAMEEEGEIFYALCDHCCSSENHVHDHIHFKCSKCGNVSCEDLKEEITINLPNVKIDSISLIVTGTCASCL